MVYCEDATNTRHGIACTFPLMCSLFISVDEVFLLAASTKEPPSPLSKVICI